MMLSVNNEISRCLRSSAFLQFFYRHFVSRRTQSHTVACANRYILQLTRLIAKRNNQINQNKYQKSLPSGKLTHSTKGLPRGKILFRVYTNYNPPSRMEQLTILLECHLNFILYNSKKGEKADMHEVRRGFTFPIVFFPKITWNIFTRRCTKVIEHCACAVKWTSLRRNSFRSGQTLSPARKST